MRNLLLLILLSALLFACSKDELYTCECIVTPFAGSTNTTPTIQTFNISADSEKAASTDCSERSSVDDDGNTSKCSLK